MVLRQSGGLKFFSNLVVGILFTDGNGIMTRLSPVIDGLEIPTATAFQIWSRKRGEKKNEDERIRIG